MANNNAVEPVYNVFDMMGNRIAGLGTPVYPTDAEVHGHTHTAEQLSVVPNSKVGAANGVASLDAVGLMPSGQLPLLLEDALVDATALANKEIVLDDEVNTSLPVRIYIRSTENYRSPDLLLGVDIAFEENNKTLTWSSLGLDGLLESGDRIYVEFYKL